MGRYIREIGADRVIEDHLTQKPGRDFCLHGLADDKAIVDESISDVADQWDERCGQRSALSVRRR